MEKQQRWQALSDRFQKVHDGLGKHLDPGILETVVALNALDIHTMASCEGHLNWGVGAPWVDLEKERPEEKQQIREAFKHAESQRDLLPKEEGDQLFLQAHALREALKAQSAVGSQQLMDYLALFYTDRSSIPYDQRLILSALGNWGRFRLESQGAEFQNILPETLRQARLQAYQEEMRTFTAFLKAQFFQE